MSKIKKIEPLVKKVLERDEEARNDDFYLIGNVYYNINKNIKNMPFLYVIANHKELGMPSFESITRCRRKLQSEYEHLKASKKMQEIRLDLEQEFIEYSKE